MKSVIIRGSGGGEEKKQKQPFEADNNVQSTATARVVDLVGVGPLRLLYPDDVRKNIEFDQTVLQEQDGTLNFQGVDADFRPGTVDQTFLPGIPDVERENSVGIELRYNVPTIRTVTTPNLDAIRVTLRWPALFSQDNKGNINETTIHFTIEVRALGSTYQLAVDRSFSGKNNGPYEEEHLIDLYGDPPWDIRVTKRVGDSSSASLQNTTIWSRFTEIQYAKLSYPEMALFSIIVDRRLFGNEIAVRSFLVGAELPIPSNYDPDTRTYSGFWDGTFKLGVSDNPAWVTWDAITSKTRGLRIDASYVDKWSFYEAAQFCDELVPDGYGGTRPRYTFNGVFAASANGIETVQAIAGIYRGIVYWGSITVVAIDRPRMPTRLFAPANVQDGIFNYISQGIYDQYSVVKVVWNDFDNFSRPTPEVVEDDSGLIEQIGIREHQIAAVGCSNRAEAYTIGRWWLETQRASSTAVTFVTGLEAIDLMPAEVILVNDPLAGEIRAGGRIISSTTTYVELDGDIIITPDETPTISFTVEIARVSRDDLSFDANSSSIVSSTTDFIAEGFLPGRSVSISGSRVPSNNGVFIVRVVDHNRLAISGSFIADAAGVKITVVERYLIDRRISARNIFRNAIIDGSKAIKDDGRSVVLLDSDSATPIASEGARIVDSGLSVVVPGVTNVRETPYVFFDEPLPWALNPGAIWMLTSSVDRQFSVLSVNQIARNKLEVIAASYDPTKWDRIDRDIRLTDIPANTLYPSGPIVGPSGIVATEYLIKSGLGVQAVADISWTRSPDVRVRYYEIEVIAADQSAWRDIGIVDVPPKTIDVNSAGIWSIRVRAVDRLGARSQWEAVSVSLLGLLLPPDPPTDLRASISGSQMQLTWVAPDNLDLSHFVLRWSPYSGATWGSATEIAGIIPGQATMTQVPARNGTYLLKSVDFSDVECTSAAAAEVNSAAFEDFNVVEVISDSPLWAGSSDGLVSVAGKLRLSPTTVMHDWVRLSDVETLSGNARTTHGRYEFSAILDLGGTYRCRIVPSVNMEIFNSLNTMSSWHTLSEVKTLSGVSGDEISISFEMMIDNGDWTELRAGDYSGRLFRFAMNVDSGFSWITPVIADASVTVDMPDRIVSGSDVICPDSGMHVAFYPPFYGNRPTVVVDSQDLQTGDYREISNISSGGFDIIFKNAGGNAVQRSFDFIAKGYGVGA